MSIQAPWKDSLIRTRVHKIEGTTIGERLQNSINYYRGMLDKYEAKHGEYSCPNPKMTINKLAVLEEVIKGVLICSDCNRWDCSGCI